MAKVTQAVKRGKSNKFVSEAIDLVREVEDLGCEFCTPLEPQGVMEALVKRIVGRYDVNAAVIWKLNETGSLLELGAAAGSPELPTSLNNPRLDQTLMGKAVRERAPHIYPTNHDDGDEVAAWAHENGLRFVAAYPLLQEPRVHGVLLLASSKAPDEPLLALFRLHARLASVALRDAELFSSTVRTLTS